MPIKISNYRSLPLIALAMMTIGSCKKDEEEKPVAPIIVYQSISASTVEQFNNNVSINFTFEDYQGDLGRDDPDDYSLRVLDARLSDYDWYHVMPMTPNNEELHIKGSYTLTVDPLFILGTGTQESTTLSLQIQDRAGNWSNVIETPVVLIVDSL